MTRDLQELDPLSSQWNLSISTCCGLKKNNPYLTKVEGHRPIPREGSVGADEPSSCIKGPQFTIITRDSIKRSKYSNRAVKYSYIAVSRSKHYTITAIQHVCTEMQLNCSTLVHTFQKFSGDHALVFTCLAGLYTLTLTKKVHFSLEWNCPTTSPGYRPEVVFLS